MTGAVAWDRPKRRLEDRTALQSESYSFHAKSENFKRRLFVLELAVSALVFLVLLDIRFLVGAPGDVWYAGHVGVLCGVLATITLLWPEGNSHFNRRPRAYLTTLIVVGRMMLTSFAITAVALFIFKMDFVSRPVLVGFFVTNTIVLVAMRWFLAWWYLADGHEIKESRLKLLIVGSGPRAQRLALKMRGCSEWGVDVIGFLDPNPKAFNRRRTDNILGDIYDISSVLQKNVVDEVIVALPRRMLGDLESIVMACQEEGVRLRFMADIYDFDAARVQLTMIDRIPVLSFESVAPNDSLILVKRLFDILAVMLILPVLLPVFLLTALAIRIESPGPAIFVQERVGLHKRRFKMYKFRSMVADAEARMHEVEHLNEATGPNFKIKNDPRLTRIGNFLRRSSIDELPQLINVLKGDMSLVGPRPMSVRDVELFDRGIQRKRFSVRPGMTCLWQISGRSDLSFDEWLMLDLKYVEHWTLGLDLKILMMTIPSVLNGRGAA